GKRCAMPSIPGRHSGKRMEASYAKLLEVTDLSIEFRQGVRQILAVDHISFSVAKGETVALVGESGSGKSVTALSVLKLLPYPAAHHPTGSIRFKGEELLDRTEPEIRHVRGNDITIIFQEPMTSLNPLHTIEKQIRGLLKELQSRLGMAMLFITHDLGIVRRLADTVCVMKEGKIVETGPVERVFTAPTHPYTRALLAAEPKPDPAPLRSGAPIVVETKDLKVWFPVKRGVMRRVVGHIKAVDGVSIAVRQG